MKELKQSTDSLGRGKEERDGLQVGIADRTVVEIVTGGNKATDGEEVFEEDQQSQD